MQLIDQHSKKIMEECKEKARDAGLQFENDTLEYIVTNRDMLELSPKMMIPTLYDYWVHDVEVIREKGRYELYPSNPYETVINTRPAISFYNDNNPDWLNVLIFYHVLAHIDFFQNNVYFRHTWDYDFNGEALADKRLIARLRSEKGRWVDYVIEFARGIDNLVGYYTELSYYERPPVKSEKQQQLDYYFDLFLQSEKNISTSEYLQEVEKYNQYCKEHAQMGQQLFFAEVRKKYPEFDEKFKKYRQEKKLGKLDLLQYLNQYSDFLNKQDNKWMQTVLEVVRRTSIFFQPQIRTKIMNEGWATYWHEKLFLQDERIQGHEIDFSKAHSKVASLHRVGMNPYALGWRLFMDVEQGSNLGRHSFDFQKIKDQTQRQKYDRKTERGQEFIFHIRKYYSDFMFINDFLNQDFIDRYKLFVAGKRLNKAKRTWQYYVKSRKAEDYRRMLFENMYHPPKISFQEKQDGTLYLTHQFEGKPLVQEFIANTMLGIEYLWGRPVQLETHEVVAGQKGSGENEENQKLAWQKVLYTMKKRSLSKKIVENYSDEPGGISFRI